MAVYEGSSGQVELDSTAVAEVRTWSVTHTREAVESTAMGGDGFRTYKKGLQVWSGTMEVVYSDSEGASVETALNPDTDSDITVKFYTDSNATTTGVFEGTVIVTSFSVSTPFDGIVTATVEFQGVGAPTVTNWNY